MTEDDAALQRFQRHYVRGPEVRAFSPFGRLAVMYRRLLLRATLNLREYYRHIHQALFDAVGESEARSRLALEGIRAEASALRAALEPIRTAMAQLQSALDTVRAETAILPPAIRDLQGRLAGGEQRLDAVDTRAAIATALNDELEHRTSTTERHVASLTARISEAEAETICVARRTEEACSATQHELSLTAVQVADLARQISQIDTRTNELVRRAVHVESQAHEITERSIRTEIQIAEITRVNDALVSEVHELRDVAAKASKDVAFTYGELTATPYLAEYDAVHVLDEYGRPQLGFVGPGHNGNYASFEDVFRGKEDMIRARQHVYLQFLTGRGRVVDLGAGRGEMLDLLAEAGIDAVGVDLDQEMVHRAVAKGRKVECADALDFLEQQADGSLGAIFSAQFVEHLQPRVLLHLLRVARTKLGPGGVIVTETVNPHSPRALKAFWADLSHVHPLFPESLVMWHRLIGYTRARVVFPCGTGDLSDDLRTQGEFAVVAFGGDRSPG
jgi:SAM-dependent methyltransferase/predicted  nucleic acid-binding Zn-ribbon protein